MNWLIFTACAAAIAVLLIRQVQGEGATFEGDQNAASDTPPTDGLGGFTLPSLDGWAGYSPPAAIDYSAPDAGLDQLPSAAGTFMAALSNAPLAFSDAIGLTAPPSPDHADQNVRAFLDMISYAEGTSGPDGYRTLFGGGTFASFAEHPDQRIPFTNGRGEKLYSSAAGRYQFLKRTWAELAKALNLADFSPANQDAAAIELIRRRGALKDVQAGRIAAAVTKIAPIWASMPGAGYAQPEKKLTTLVAKYSAAGGNLEA